MARRRELSRIIDTSLYIEDYQGLGVVWFAGELNPSKINGILIRPFPLSYEQVPREMQAMLARVKGLTSSNEGLPANSRVVQQMLSSEIIVQRSPPVALPLGKLLEKSPGIAIGTYIGIQAAGMNPILMLVTVPGGILIVSSAIAIARAVEQGLHRKVLAALAKTKPAAKPRQTARRG